MRFGKKSLAVSAAFFLLLALQVSAFGKQGGLDPVSSYSGTVVVCESPGLSNTLVELPFGQPPHAKILKCEANLALIPYTPVRVPAYGGKLAGSDAQSTDREVEIKVLPKLTFTYDGGTVSSYGSSITISEVEGQRTARYSSAGERLGEKTDVLCETMGLEITSVSNRPKDAIELSDTGSDCALLAWSTHVYYESAYSSPAFIREVSISDVLAYLYGG